MLSRGRAGQVWMHAGGDALYDKPSVGKRSHKKLSNELKHVFAFENMKVLRHAKRFMNMPCPLISVEWWRICLDEAQMVHSNNSKVRYIIVYSILF